MKKKIATRTLVLGAVLTAVVVVLQVAGAFIKLGPFSISLVLVPIVIGAACCGIEIGTWLGFIFGVAVLLSGDASSFLMINAPATILIVLLKGTLAGLASGSVYRWLSGKNHVAAVAAAAIVCPIVNTGVFLIGASLAFWDTLAMWAQGLGFGDNVTAYLFLGLVGGNFLVELAINIVLCPVIVRLLNIVGKGKNS